MKVEDIGEKGERVENRGLESDSIDSCICGESDFILILVPSSYHSDRKVPTCYRTWRRRGWCLLGGMQQ